MAGALLLPEIVDFERDPWLSEIADSKCLTPEKREELAPRIEAWARSFADRRRKCRGDRPDQYFPRLPSGDGACGARRARAACASAAGHSELFTRSSTANFFPKTCLARRTAVIKGDLQCLSVAAASILAKVWRDRLMAEIDVRHPGYGFAAHKGYSTPAHAEALKRLGACDLHRRSFAPVAARVCSAV